MTGATAQGTPPVRRFPDRQQLAAGLADRIAADLAAALAARGRARLAVPGGTTPGPFLTALARHPLDWTRIAVTLTDERWVPPDHPRSNARLLRECFLDAGAAAARFVPLFAAGADPDAAAAAIAEAVAREVLPLDVCVLGMGADLHTASLFPGADRLAEALDPECPVAVLPIRAPGAAEARITLTLPSLVSAGHIYILIAGAEKLAALDAALAPGPVAEGPVRAVLRSGRPVDVFHAP